jgi:hypothetical protein
MTTTKETDDATARTVGGTVALVGFGVIVLQDLQGHLHTLNALSHLCAVLVVPRPLVY